ncbi:hypothetical protein [Candidatus Cyanaurora vandensis]|uniref:hypothetical protein n=1 Tax=Candidatus Cyanaurora vandensis TaxID=2714958 RepID=UPI00257D771C|nr:hypothetical protein [Candidatus Cyanaurora vandensis]
MRYRYLLSTLFLVVAPCHADTALMGTIKTAAPSLALYDTTPRDNRGVLSGRFTVGSETFDNLWVLPGRKGTFFSLDMGKASPWTSFKFTLRPYVPFAGYTGPVAIEVFGDNRRLFGQSFTAEQLDLPLQVDVTNVRTLMVKVDPVCATEDTANPRALSLYLANASFERTPALTATTGLAPAPVRCRAPLMVQDTPFNPPLQPLPAPVRARW